MAPNMTTAFGAVVRRLMAEKNLSQRRLAKVSGIDDFSVNAYYHGKSFPRRQNLGRLAGVFDLSPKLLVRLVKTEMRNAGKEVVAPVRVTAAPEPPPVVAQAQAPIAPPAQPVPAALDAVQIVMRKVGTRTHVTVTAEMPADEVFTLIRAFADTGRQVSVIPG